jgi:hypothetical protein
MTLLFHIQAFLDVRQSDLGNYQSWAWNLQPTAL